DGDEPAAVAAIARADRISAKPRSGELLNRFANSVAGFYLARSGNAYSRSNPAARETSASGASEGRITHRRHRVIRGKASGLVIVGSSPARNSDDLPEPLSP